MLSVVLFLLSLVVLSLRRERAIVLLGTTFALQAVTLAAAALTSGFQDWGGHVFALILITISALPPLLGLALARVQHERRH
jgi:NADH:ubiquinone oxidoreductase subunit K